MKVIITGTTGMVGEGVMLECLDNPAVQEVLSVSRKPVGRQHPKLKEYLVPDFLTLAEDDPKLRGYDACFFCAGVSSAGMAEAKYRKLTYDTTMVFARALGPKEKMSFVYISGGGTDSSEKGRMAWARIKGKTENDLFKMPFKHAFGFRVGFMTPVEGQRKVHKYYSYVSWLFPLIKVVMPNIINSMSDVGKAMIYASLHGYQKRVVKVKDIKWMARQQSR